MTVNVIDQKIETVPEPRPAPQRGVDLEAMIAEYESPLLGYVYQLLRPDQESCQDVVQTAFMKLHSHLMKNGPNGLLTPKAWLYRVAHNLSIDLLRKRKRTGELRSKLKDDPALEVHRQKPCDFKAMERTELRRFALDQLEGLPEDQRQVLTLKHIQGLTFREISEITGLTVSTVNYRLNQGLAALAKQMKNR